jgi:hypothetical protein
MTYFSCWSFPRKRESRIEAGLLLPDPRFLEDKFLEDKFRRSDIAGTSKGKDTYDVLH